MIYSFFNHPSPSASARKRINTACFAACMFVGAGIGSALMLDEIAFSQIHEKQSQVNADYTHAAERVKQIQQIETRQKKLARRAAIDAQMIDPISRSAILAAVTNALPADGSMSNFRVQQDPQGNSLVVITLIAINGAQAGECAEKLSHCSDLRDVRITNPAETSGGFQIEAKLREPAVAALASTEDEK